MIDRTHMSYPKLPLQEEKSYINSNVNGKSNNVNGSVVDEIFKTEVYRNILTNKFLPRRKNKHIIGIKTEVLILKVVISYIKIATQWFWVKFSIERLVRT